MRNGYSDNGGHAIKDPDELVNEPGCHLTCVYRRSIRHFRRVTG